MAYVGSHEFTPKIRQILEHHFGEDADAVLESSPLLQYLNGKTRSANKGSKARGAFANHYALYVLVEDYIRKGFYDGSAGTDYAKYEGARFTDLFRRQRELPFGAKLQNHALNSRLNDEFKKFFPNLGIQPIIRDVQAQRYWVHEKLLRPTVRTAGGGARAYNIAQAIIEVIDAYVATKREAFESFLATCRQLAKLDPSSPDEAIAFVVEQLRPEVDARVFEIVSYAVLKAKYGVKSVWIGEGKDSVEQQGIVLYKTGRTNANDGGIDFVMRPLGRFFQVTETIDAGKYFLDIDKVQRFPITFVVKTGETPEAILEGLRRQAMARYGVEAIVDAYMNAVEEIINVPQLLNAFGELVSSGQLSGVMSEIVRQSEVEFNYTELQDLEV